jgi:hypothetical protein
MTLQVIGAGFAKTGTSSLKLALERLLGGVCYHMVDVFAYPEHIRIWHDAVGGHPPDWDTFLTGYRTAINMPVCAFWRELAAENPDARIVLSVRDSAEQWWDSWSHTVVPAAVKAEPSPGSLLAKYQAMLLDLLRIRFGVADPADKMATMAAYERHNDAVRVGAPPGRLLEWKATDGWAPLAAHLGVSVPDEPFPWVNIRKEFHRPEFGTMPEWAQAQ